MGSGFRPDQCEADSECPTGFICVGGECVESDLGQDFFGGGDGTCRDTSDCAAGFRCQDGQCVPGGSRCRNDSNCPSGFICDPFTFQCISTDGGGTGPEDDGGGGGGGGPGVDNEREFRVTVTTSPSPSGRASFFAPNSTVTSFVNSDRIRLGSVISAYAIPTDIYRFTGWSIDIPFTAGGSIISTSPTYSFVFEGNLNLIANFELVEPPPPPAPQQYTLTLLSTPVGSGQVRAIGVTVPNASQAFGATSTVTITGLGADAFTDIINTVTIEARANEGFVFDGWYTSTETLYDTALSTEIEVLRNTTYTARFRTREAPTETYTAQCTPNRVSPWLNCEEQRVIAEPGLNLSPEEICSQFNMIPCEPTPIPERQWRSCVDGQLYPGNPPAGYGPSTYSGPGGGLCWSPITQVGFIPSLETALEFTYTRGSFQFPSTKEITAENPSTVRSYRVTLSTDENITISPSTFVLPPAGSRVFTIDVSRTFYDTLNDGTYDFDLRVEVTEL